MKFTFIGDVHGNVPHCVAVCRSNPDSLVVQIGDLGIGFIPPSKLVFPKNFRFFVGNHDCRQMANKMECCLGDYGDYQNRFFFVSGADSIDKDMRVEGVSWWSDEELSYEQSCDCVEKWRLSKSKVIVSHDIPQSFAEGYQLIYDDTLTRNLLQMMIEDRKPELIITGHHHRSKDMMINGIRWKALAENEIFTIDL